jgi:hypothetical protein
MKKGLAVFSGSAVVHKLMQDGRVELGTAVNPAAVTVSGNINVTGQLTASANNILVGNVGGEFSNTTLGGILVELKNEAANGEAALSSSLKSYIDAQDSAEAAAREAGDTAVANAAASALNAYTASNNTAVSSLTGRVGTLETTVNTLIGDTGSISAALTTIQNLAEYLDGDGNPVTLVADLSTEVSRISGALVQEATDRVSGDAAVQTNLNNVSSSLKAAIDAIQSGASGDTSALSSSLKSYIDLRDGEVSSSLSSALAAEVTRATAAEAQVQSNLDSVSGSLSGAISAEASARIAADQALSSSIDALDVRLDALEAYNGNVVHVDPVGGLDAVGNGTLLKPFRTINYAYSQVQSLGNSSNTTYNANVEKFVTEKLIFKLAPGTYAEDVVLGFKRARVALVGNGARIAGTVKMDVKKADFPASNLEAFKAQYPAPWTGFSAQMSFEIAGDAGGGLESDPTANVVTVTGRTSLEFENGGANYNWDSNFGQFYVSVDNAAILGGVVMIHDNTVTSARAPAVVLEVESSRIGNADSGSRTYCGFVPFGASTTVPSFGSLTLKAHNSTFASVIGPTMTIGEIDGCRVYDIDRTMGGVVTNGSIGGSTSTSYLGIVNTQFRAITVASQGGASVYKIGPTTGTARYKIDSVSHTTLAFSRASNGILTARALDTGSGVVYDFLDNAGSQFVSHVPVNYTMSGTVTSSLGHFAGIDAALGAQTTARNSLSSSFNTRVGSLETTVNAIVGDSATLATITSSLNSIQEIAAFLDGSGSAAQDLTLRVAAISGALVQEITDRAAAVTDLSGAVSSSLAAEIAARIAGDAAVQSNLDSVSGSLKAAIDAIQSGASGDTSALSSSLSSALAAEIARATAAEGLIQSNLDSASGSLKGYIDSLDSAQTSANSSLSSSFATALAAEASRAATAEALVQSNLDSVSGSLATAIAAEKTRAEGAEAGLQSAINTEKGRIDAILSGSSVDLDTFKEVVDFVNSIDLTNDNALLAAVTNIGADISTLSGNLVSEIQRATAAEAGLQAQINSASFSVNGMSVDPFGGAFSIVSSSNIAVASAAGVVTVSLKDSVSIAGSLSAAQLSASAGLSVTGGATVAGGLTVSTGDMQVSQGAVSTRMTRVQAAARTAQDGDMFYLTDVSDDPTGTFPRGKCWYFRQDGEWFDAPFYMG